MTKNRGNDQNNENNLVSDEQKETVNNTVSENESAKAMHDESILKSVIAGTVGVATGGAGLFAAMSFKEPDKFIHDSITASLSEAETVLETETEIETEIETENFDGSQALIAHKVSDCMSFNEAFAAARQEVGPGGVFKWHGNVYGTYYADEWKEFSDEFRNTFSNYHYNIENNTQLTEELLFAEKLQLAETDILTQDDIYPVDIEDFDDLAFFDFSSNNDYGIKVVDDNTYLDYTSTFAIEDYDTDIEDNHELIVAPVADNSFIYDIDDDDFMIDFNNNADISNFI